MASDGAAVEAASTQSVDRRRANQRKAKDANPSTDAQGLVEFECECMRSDCDRSVRAPLYVYRRMVEAGDQYLVQAGHHAFARNRTIVRLGLTSIEEPA